MGRRKVAVIDPGPDVESHLRALSRALKGADLVQVLITHGHGDHAGGAPRLAESLGAPLLAPRGYASPEATAAQVITVQEGDRIETDEGDLVVLEVPGHSKDHLAFHWLEPNALFVGDLLLGRGNTTWVGEYLGRVEDYLASLVKVEARGASMIYPTHGPPITSPTRTVERFRRHRLGRLDEVGRVRESRPRAGSEEIAEAIYGGEIPPELVKAAKSSVEAALHHLDRTETPT